MLYHIFIPFTSSNVLNYALNPTSPPCLPVEAVLVFYSGDYNSTPFCSVIKFKTLSLWSFLVTAQLSGPLTPFQNSQAIFPGGQCEHTEYSAVLTRQGCPTVNTQSSHTLSGPGHHTLPRAYCTPIPTPGTPYLVRTLQYVVRCPSPQLRGQTYKCTYLYSLRQWKAIATYMVLLCLYPLKTCAMQR
jgi:hypothetical protein